MAPGKPALHHQISIESSEFEHIIEHKCCGDRIDILVTLRLVALLEVFLDALCLAWETIIAYPFIFSTIGSFLTLCTVISSLQEEKVKLLAYTNIWISLKTVILVALTCTALIAVIDVYMSDDEQFEIAVELLLLIPTILLVLVFLAVQSLLTHKAIDYIRVRDEIYTIPSVAGQLRPEILSSILQSTIKHQRF
uniref:Transmembrane protein n=1 Tax=Steinernema glaseri TaxID=37863 RepID=A0A1I7ZJD6_9BILA